MLLAVVPAYNEAERIGSVVRSLFDHVDAVVVVDDASRDTTAAAAREAGATVLVHEINRGQGAALETGHTYARRVGAAYVIHFDGDGQFSVDDIAPALSHMQKGQADILFGSRYLDVRSTIPPFKRWVLHPVSRWIDRAFTGLQLSDYHNGFRILSRRALEQLSITQDRMAHASEIPRQVRRLGLRHVEFPIKVTYHEYGQGTLSGLTILRDLFFGRFLK